MILEGGITLGSVGWWARLGCFLEDMRLGALREAAPIGIVCQNVRLDKSYRLDRRDSGNSKSPGIYLPGLI